MRVAIITANTEIYRETEADESGAVIREMMKEAGWDIVFQKALPLDRKVLGTVMQRMADGHLTDLILTTGGAGCKPQDCTPEATKEKWLRERSKHAGTDVETDAEGTGDLPGAQRICSRDRREGIDF